MSGFWWFITGFASACALVSVLVLWMERRLPPPEESAGE